MKQTISFLPSTPFDFPNLRINFKAPSFASVPELAKKTLSPEESSVECVVAEEEQEGSGKPRPPCCFVRWTMRSANSPDHSL